MEHCPTNWTTTPLKLAYLAAVIASLTACSSGFVTGNWKHACESVGLCDAPTPSAEVFDAVVDNAADGTGDREHLVATLEVVLRRAAARPGSRVRLWAMLGASVGDTEMVAEQVSPKLRAKSDRARERETARWITSAEEVFLVGATPCLRGWRPKESPISESLTKVGLAEGYGLKRSIIVISDGRDSLFASLSYYRQLPTDKEWRAGLRHRRLLQPASLQGIAVWFTYLTLTPLVGHSASVGQELRLRDLWQLAAGEAGAESVSFSSGVVHFVDHDPPSTVTAEAAK